MTRCVTSPIPFAAILLLLTVSSSRSAFAQAPPAPPQPPPRLEASAQFTFLDTSGNASSQSLGAGGLLVWRPDPWTYSAKAIFAQAETDNELSARSFAGLFRSSRALNERLSVDGHNDFLRDVFAGVEQRHVIEGGVLGSDPRHAAASTSIRRGPWVPLRARPVTTSIQRRCRWPRPTGLRSRTRQSRSTSRGFSCRSRKQERGSSIRTSR